MISGIANPGNTKRVNIGINIEHSDNTIEVIPILKSLSSNLYPNKNIENV